MNKNVVLIVLWFFVLIAAMNAYVRILVGEPQKEPSPVPRALQEVPREVSAGQQRPVRQPDDPAKFGILVVDPRERLADQGQWDVFVDEILNRSGALDTPQAKQAIGKMQMNPAQYEKTMRRLDEEIAKIEEASRGNSTDPLLKRRRDVLYQMKSVSRVLEKKGIVDPGAASLPEYDQGVIADAGSVPPLE